MLISGEKMLMSTELKKCIMWFIYFLDLRWVRYNCAKFHHFRICVKNFREGGLFAPPPHPWAAPKKPILNRINLWFNALFKFFMFITYCSLSYKFATSFSNFSHFGFSGKKGESFWRLFKFSGYWTSTSKKCSSSLSSL